MKTKIEIDLDKSTHEWLEKMAKTLGMKRSSQLLEKELGDMIDSWNMQFDRFYNLQIRYPSLFSERLS